MLTLLTLSTAGCAAEFDLRSNGSGSTVIVYHSKTVDSGMAALLTATIQVIDGCLMLQDPLGQMFVPVFPQDQVKLASPPLVMTFRGEDFADGDEIQLGGGPGKNLDLPPCHGTAWLINPSG